MVVEEHWVRVGQVVVGLAVAVGVEEEEDES
jgi:hypothetical protein